MPSAAKAYMNIVVLVNFIIVHPGSYLPQELLGVRKQYDSYTRQTREDNDAIELTRNISLGLWD